VSHASERIIVRVSMTIAAFTVCMSLLTWQQDMHLAFFKAHGKRGLCLLPWSPRFNHRPCHVHIYVHTFIYGAHGGAVVEALHYKPEGQGTDSRSCHWNFSFT
jgi:hypothetical protein